MEAETSKTEKQFNFQFSTHINEISFCIIQNVTSQNLLISNYCHVHNI